MLGGISSAFWKNLRLSVTSFLGGVHHLEVESLVAEAVLPEEVVLPAAVEGRIKESQQVLAHISRHVPVDTKIVGEAIASRNGAAGQTMKAAVLAVVEAPTVVVPVVAVVPTERSKALRGVVQTVVTAVKAARVVAAKVVGATVETRADRTRVGATMGGKERLFIRAMAGDHYRAMLIYGFTTFLCSPAIAKFRESIGIEPKQICP
jgi:hypothetical protein